MGPPCSSAVSGSCRGLALTNCPAAEGEASGGETDSDMEQTARKASHRRASTSSRDAEDGGQSLSERKRANVQAMLSGRCAKSQGC